MGVNIYSEPLHHSLSFDPPLCNLGFTVQFTGQLTKGQQNYTFWFVLTILCDSILHWRQMTAGMQNTRDLPRTISCLISC
jgi:hypothetical protein